MNKHNAYAFLMTLVLTSIGIKYGVSDTKAFQQSSPSMLLFLTAISCHALASIADHMTEQTTIIMIVFHVSGVVGCEALLWILLAEFLWYIIINLLLLLLASFCFFNYISQLLHGTPSNTDLIQPQEDQV